MAVLALALGCPLDARAQTVCSDATVPGVNVEYFEDDVLIPKPNSCNLLPCHKPEHLGTTGGDGELRVRLRFPGNHQFITNNHVRFYWFDTPEPFPGNCLPPPYANCNPIAVCGLLGAEILTDEGTAVLQVSCPAFAAAAGSKVFSLSAYACQTFTGECTQKLDIPDLEVWNSACLPKPTCEDKCSCAYGGGTAGGSDGPGAPAAGGGATLRYRAGGAGYPLFPGASLWRSTLGRYWSHDYAERIVEDPDASHVWLITQHATFREFTDANGDGVYEKNAPSDEYRRLRKVASGWELADLEGGVQSFDAQGRWTRTQDAHGNAKVAVYSGGGQLVRVDMPDGRSETFSYHSSGKLAALTEVGVDGTTSRTWRYTWSGDDLARIDAPDGRAWTFRYDDPRLPGYMTRMTLVGTDGSERVEGAWEYDSQGNLTRRWKGDPSPSGPGAVEQTSYSYDNPYLPRETRVTDPLGKVSTYVVGRDPVSQKPRVESLSGACPACGTAPDSQTFYDDPRHPLLKTREIDASGRVTFYAYDADGQVTSRTEAFGTPLQRTTTWEYAGPFPALVTAVETPSTSGSGSRRTLFTYDAKGNRLTETIEGVEAGSAFRYTTAYTPNASGALQEIDPPGFGVTDVTRFTYDPARGNLLPLDRTDPLVGATSFAYDAWNRPTATTDPNGVRTLTGYDLLNRTVQVTHEGATAAESLITQYEYTPLGDLARIILPRGNLIEYSYDTAGRLIATERKPHRGTPGERVVFTLDGAGNRIREEHQRWDSGAWVTDSFTGYSYSSNCHLDKILHADGSVTEFAYDCDGNLERVWDANHPSDNRANPATTIYGYDQLQRMTLVSQPWKGAGGGSASIRYEYDVQDHLVKVIDAEGNTNAYVYSDRGLMTRKVSEASGLAEYRYNENGELTSEADARGTTVAHTTDLLGRRVSSDFPEDALDTRWIFDDPAVPFSKGQLTAIVRNGDTIAYGYDRFGRVLRDGALTYSYDPNGNRREIGYPGGRTAVYTFDFADREERLMLTEPGQGPRTVAADARYLASGPLASLVLGNGLAETRSFDERYLPITIRVPGKLDWQLTSDNVGNILSIQDSLDPAGPRQYTYQDVAYFLSSAAGPWGQFSWTYDKSGNRLTQNVSGITESYSYVRNPAGGNNPRLATVTPPSPGVPTSYYYDAIGNQTYRATGGEKIRFGYNAEQKLSQIAKDVPAAPPALIRLTYDGRDLLSTSTFQGPSGADFQLRTQATYTSGGVLLHSFTESRSGASEPRDKDVRATENFVLYFAGRPIGLLEKAISFSTAGPLIESQRLLYISTDQLGAPALLTDESGTSLWMGGFSPFGEDDAQAQEAGLFLRLPGQWTDKTWQNGSAASSIYYNVHRWYEPRTGRYLQPDPIEISFGPSNNPGSYFVPGYPFAYVANNPLRFSDPLGLTLEDALCVFKWTLIGGFLGSLGGAGVGCAAAGTAGTFVAPGVGTLGGCAAGAYTGALLGGAAGALGGTIYGTIVCGCPIEMSRPRGGKWTCVSKCHVKNFSGVPGAPPFVSATASGPSRDVACALAESAARALSPPGTHTRHCKCTCVKR